MCKRWNEREREEKEKNVEKKNTRKRNKIEAQIILTEATVV